MKLQTFIKPRADGTVKVFGEDSQKYTFTADADGALVCDVVCEATAARLLASGNFEPVDAADFDKAIALSMAAAPQDDDAEEADDDFTEEVVPGGLPVESNTPPVARKARKSKTA